MPEFESESSHTVDNSWKISQTAEVGGRVVDINPSMRDVLGENGQKLGSILTANVQLAPGETSARIGVQFSKDPNGVYRVNTEGFTAWASALERPTQPKPMVAGMRSMEQAYGGKTDRYFEPGESHKIPSDEGRSYGMVSFRDTEGGGNFILGIIPDMAGTDLIRFRKNPDDPHSITVFVEKNVEGNAIQRNVTFTIFTGQGNPHGGEPGERYADILKAYSKELASSVKEKAPLMHDRVIGFSWPVYGPGVTEADIRQEVTAGKGILTDYIIDDGWETASGSMEVAAEKFPDMQRLAQEMRDNGIKPGIWTAPFLIKEPAAGKLMAEHPDWFMRDAEGKPVKVLPMFRSKGGSRLPIDRPYALDVSNPEFRAYLVEKYSQLAETGFDVFKADFLAVPFMGSLQNNDKTQVEYYRQVFEEIREGVRERAGKEIEIIGCGAPLLQSIGLFNGMRITADSAFSNLEGIPGYEKTFHLLRNLTRRPIRKINTKYYRDAVSTAAKRALPYNGVFGAVLDGVHLNDPDISMKIPVNKKGRNRFTETIIALRGLGLDNITVGDSFARIGEEGREEWKEYVEEFRQKQPLAIARV